MNLIFGYLSSPRIIINHPSYLFLSFTYFSKTSRIEAPVLILLKIETEKFVDFEFSEIEPIKQGLLVLRWCSISEIASGRVKCSRREALTVLAI